VIILSDRYAEAFAYALELHRNQPRKETEIPYVAHLMAVSGLVLEHGGSEIEAIAALLHDAVEDQGGPPTLAEIQRRFGDEVARIVEGCSDTDATLKPAWRKRKEDYVAHVRRAPASVRLVSAADKLHNARAILADYRVHGESLWARFRGGKEGTLWYYRALADTYRSALVEGDHGRLVAELDRVVSKLEKLAAAQRVPQQPISEV
jgi:(p)ppGpp synthase/HD superfamily hydrolase